MEFENKEWEMSFGDLFRNALYKWKGILAVAVVFALLLGGFQGWKTVKNNAKASDEAAVAAYQAELALNEQLLANTEKQVTNYEEYMAASPMMQMNADNAYVAEAYLYISTGYQIMPGMDYQNPDETGSILSIYQNVLTGADTLNRISGEVGIAPRHLSDLILIEKETAHLLHFRVYHWDAAVAEAILEQLLSQVEEAGKSASELICDHTAQVMYQMVERCSDFSVIGDQLEKRFKTLTGYQKDITTLEEQIKTLKKSSPAFAPKGVIKQAVIWAVVGGVLGAGMMAVLICLVFIFRTTVYSAEELKDRAKLTVLGSVAEKNAYRDPVVRLLRKAEGRAQPDPEVSAELIAENLLYYVPEGKQLLIAGTVGQEAVQKMTEALQGKTGGSKLVSGGNLLAEAGAVRQLRECDGVILLAQCGKTRYKDIFRTAAYVASIGKQLIGCIVID